jgi:hypothetical protein
MSKYYKCNEAKDDETDGHVENTGEMRNTYKILVGKSENLDVDGRIILKLVVY